MLFYKDIDQDQNQERANRQQDPLFKLKPTPIGAQRELELLHRRPLDQLELPTVEQVDDDRCSREDRADQQQRC